MPRPKADSAESKDRRKRAHEWKMFRCGHLFSQRRLADLAGISRRTIQQIENAHITPHATTLRLFETFRKKHEDTL